MAHDPDAQRTFSIVELQRTSTGTYVETATRFDWDRKTRSSPRHGWEYALQMRTVREDYPGSDQPTEQVLGAHFEPFTISGMWDDRYARTLTDDGSGFAENQRVEFEKLVGRGNLCRVSFETITFTGILTNFRATYFQSYRIGYKFTLSPHYRVEGGDFRRGDVLIPVTANPALALADVEDILDQLGIAHAAAPGPYVQGTLVSDVLNQIDDMSNRATVIGNVIQGQVLTANADGPNSLSRVVQGFQGLRDSAAAMLPILAARSTATDLAYEDAIPNLTFESWVRGVSNLSRQVIVSANAAAKLIGRLVDQKPRAIYLPKRGESLYAISNRFYATPHRWRDIAARNNLTQLSLAGTEVLIIPDTKSAPTA
jgi:hypothetical protein